MNEEAKDKFLYDLYYNKKFQTGRDSLFNHIRNTLKNTDISRRYIAAFLAKQETHQLQTARKPTTNIRPIITNRPGSMIQIDLIDFSNKSISGYRYILNVIDTFSRKVWLAKLRNKSILSINKALKNIIEDIEKDYKINVIQSDNGLEFNNISFFGIKHIKSRPYTPQQQALVERSNGTIKNILNRIMLSEKSKNWVKFLDDIQEVYNESYNRSLGMSPNLAYNLDLDKQAELHQKQKDIKSKSYKEINTVLKGGDTVRILIEKGKQKSKGENNWSQELYTVKTVIPANKENFTIPRYKVIDSDGKLQKNNFPLSKLLYISAVEKK